MGEIDLRPANPADGEMIFCWRNHPVVRRYSGDAREIDWETHCEWFRQSLQNPNRILLIAEADGNPLGVLRYDLSETRLSTQQSAQVSVYLKPEKIGQGYGANLLVAGVQWIRNQHPSVSKLVAEILPENAASIRAFERAGYVKSDAPAAQPAVCREKLIYEYAIP